METIGTWFRSSPVHDICLLVSREETAVTAESSSKTGPLASASILGCSPLSLLGSVLPVLFLSNCSLHRGRQSLCERQTADLNARHVPSTLGWPWGKVASCLLFIPYPLRARSAWPAPLCTCAVNRVKLLPAWEVQVCDSGRHSRGCSVLSSQKGKRILSFWFPVITWLTGMVPRNSEFRPQIVVSNSDKNSWKMLRPNCGHWAWTWNCQSRLGVL